MNAEPKPASSTYSNQPLRYGWGSYKDDTMVIRRKNIVMEARGGAAAIPDPMIPDMNKRNLMNSILLASVAGSVGCLGGPFLYYFYPATSGSSGGGLTAKDANGDDVTLKSWMSNHKEGDR